MRGGFLRPVSIFASQSVLRPTRPAQHLLRVAATLPVERDPLTDAEVISKTTHQSFLLRVVVPISRYRRGEKRVSELGPSAAMTSV